jgi:hypothetical protein
MAEALPSTSLSLFISLLRYWYLYATLRTGVPESIGSKKMCICALTQTFLVKGYNISYSSLVWYHVKLDGSNDGSSLG